MNVCEESNSDCSWSSCSSDSGSDHVRIRSFRLFLFLYPSLCHLLSALTSKSLRCNAILVSAWLRRTDQDGCYVGSRVRGGERTARMIGVILIDDEAGFNERLSSRSVVALWHESILPRLIPSTPFPLSHLFHNWKENNNSNSNGNTAHCNFSLAFARTSLWHTTNCKP